MNLQDAVAALARKRAAMKGIEAEYWRQVKEREGLEAQVVEVALADYANNGDEKPLEGVEIRLGHIYREPHVRIVSDLSMWEEGQ